MDCINLICKSRAVHTVSIGHGVGIRLDFLLFVGVDAGDKNCGVAGFDLKAVIAECSRGRIIGGSLGIRFALREGLNKADAHQFIAGDGAHGLAQILGQDVRTRLELDCGIGQSACIRIISYTALASDRNFLRTEVLNVKVETLDRCDILLINAFDHLVHDHSGGGNLSLPPSSC